MESQGAFFYELVLPGLAMLITERVLVWRLLRTPEQQAWVRRTFWLHPNFISKARFPMGFVSIFLYHFGLPKFAILFFAFWMITDLTDGDIARKCGLLSEEGESIDPLSDKWLYGPVLVYISYMGLLNPYAVGLFVVFDIIGQTSRRFIKNKAANLFGKAKTFMVVVLLFLTTVKLTYGNAPFIQFSSLLMWACVVLGFCSSAFKIIPNYWYANILSILNLVCGLSGIAVILMGKSPIYAFGLVFLGQFLDLFDGRAAERWGSTPRGEIFDDVADGTSFGATVGLIVIVSFENLWVGIAIGAVHVAATAYRLVRFVVEKRKDGIEGGVETFSGMPSPGGALLTGSGCLVFASDPIQGALVLIVSALMISRVAYPHFGRAILPRIPKMVRVVALVLFIFLLARGVRTENYDLILEIVFGFSIGYLLTPLINFAPKTAVKG